MNVDMCSGNGVREQMCGMQLARWTTRLEIDTLSMKRLVQELCRLDSVQMQLEFREKC